jgi:hypothetical protein
VIEIIAKGGEVMIFIIGLSIYALAVIFYKIHQFFTSGIFDTSYVDRVMVPISATISSCCSSDQSASNCAWTSSSRWPSA